jgi:vancomycin resistance protein YoaR
MRQSNSLRDPAREVPYPRPLPPRKGKRSSIFPWLIRIPLLGFTAFLLLGFIAALYVALHQLQFDGLIYPGVSSYGVDLSGMTRQQAYAALSAQYTYGEQATFTFRDGSETWQKTAKDLGVSFDPQRTVEEAYRVGRGGNVFRNLAAQGDAWMNGNPIQPTIVFDESKASAILTEIGAQIFQPMTDASILVQGTQVSTGTAQIGRQLDIPATLGLVREVVLNMNTGAEIQLIVRETKPTITDAETAGAQLRTALASPIELVAESVEGLGPWQASPDFIAGMVSVVREDNSDGTARYEVVTTLDPLRTFLAELQPQLTIEPVSARFLFNSVTRQLDVIEDSVDGRELDVEATLTAVQQVLFSPGPRRVSLVFRAKPAAINSKSTAAELGINEMTVEATTFFYGSTTERRTNIQVAAARFHGLVIEPGETFSFNKYLGDVSPESGYETGLVIYGNQTIQGVGGGVCQVSTTIFQAAFFGGFPIDERYAHGYRVGYYESGQVIAAGRKYSTGVGLDATVYSPIIDFKFTNDTPYHILIEVDYKPNEQQLTIRFYTTSVGRVVEKDGPELSNTVPHGPPVYTESADLKPGQSRQIDYAVDGVDVRVYRTVYQNDSLISDREEFYSHYLPWSAQFLVAPGGAPRR